MLLTYIPPKSPFLYYAIELADEYVILVFSARQGSAYLHQSDCFSGVLHVIVPQQEVLIQHVIPPMASVSVKSSQNAGDVTSVRKDPVF